MSPSIVRISHFALGIVIAFFIALASGKVLGQDNTQTAPPPLTGPVSTGLRVFTCGNSFHAWYVPYVMADMAKKAGIEGHVIVGVSKIGGSKAIQHWDVPDDKIR